MSYPTYCRPYYPASYPCGLPWWRDTHYDDYCYQPPRSPLRRCYSFDSSPLRTYHPPKPRRDHPVKIYVNIRYKYTSNCDTLLCDQVCVQISPQCNVMDVWRAAKKRTSYLRHFEPTEKVLATDSHHKYFTEICSQARIKDEFDKSERHWVFVVYPPYNCQLKDDKDKKHKKNKKEKNARKDKQDKKNSSKKRSSNASYSCGCC